MKTEIVMAGIVTYNPDIARLDENIAAITAQVDALIIVDNGSENVKEIEILLKRHENDGSCQVQLVPFGQNKGIAEALNEIMSYAYVHGYSWVVTLDQDSVSPEGMVEKYMTYSNLENVAMISPVITDRNSKKVIKGDCKYEFIDRCITSGAMTRTVDWNFLKSKWGGYNNALFIDYVDFDFCAQLKACDKKIIRVNSVLFRHEIGKAKDHIIFGKVIPVGNHSAQRKYYIARNQLYYIKKYREYIDVQHEYRNLAELFVYVVLFEDDKIQKLKMMIKGLHDAKKMM